MPVFFLKQGSRKLQDALPGFIEPLIAGQSIGSELGGRFDRGITELGRVFVFFLFWTQKNASICWFFSVPFWMNHLWSTNCMVRGNWGNYIKSFSMKCNGVVCFLMGNSKVVDSGAWWIVCMQGQFFRQSGNIYNIVSFMLYTQPCWMQLFRC